MPRTPKYVGCFVDDCNRPHYCKGYCSAHYSRVKTLGDPMTDRPIGDQSGKWNQNAKHGLATKPTPEYRTWKSMRTRCNNPRDEHWPRYGGRGIKVCERWNVFKNFLADMGSKLTPAHTIERKNNDGDYEPWNCIWATAKEQGSNRSTSRLLAFNGRIQTLSQWAGEVGLGVDTLWKRLVKRGWSIEKALTTPKQ